MAAHKPNKLPHVLFEVRGGLFAVPSEKVREIVILPQVTHMPELPPEIRGVINLRGRVMQLIDLRVKLGMPSALAELNELVQMLHDREQDHRNWLTELENLRVRATAVQTGTRSPRLPVWQVV